MKEIFREQLQAFGQFSQSEVDALFKLGVRKDYKKGELIYQPGDNRKAGYFLASGIVANYYMGNDGKKYVTKFSSDGEFMTSSLPNLFHNTPSKLYCEALTAVKGSELQENKIIPFAQTNPKLYKIIIARFLEEIRDNQFRRISKTTMSATERYQHFNNEFSKITDQIPSRLIASYLSIEPGSLSRIRKQLRKNQ